MFGVKILWQMFYASYEYILKIIPNVKFFYVDETIVLVWEPLLNISITILKVPEVLMSF